MTPPVGGNGAIRWSFIFAIAALMGGAVTGAFVYLIGESMRATTRLPDIVAATTMVLTSVFLAGAVIGRTIPTLTGKWVVPRSWGAYGGHAYAALFGFHLGLGWRTRIGSNVFWLLVLGAALEVRFAWAVLPFIIFGAVRAVPILLVGAVRTFITTTPRPEITLMDARIIRGIGNSRYAHYASLLSAVALGAGVFSFLIQ